MPYAASRARTPALIYAALIVYGSLYPFIGWHGPLDAALDFLTAPWSRHVSRSDIITNVLVYLPLGGLAARSLRYRLNPWLAFLAATLLGLALSFSMESLQVWLPGRVSSRLDWLLNGLGTALGALGAALVQARWGPLRRLAQVRRQWFLPGPTADLGLLVLALWGFAQLVPLLLYLDPDSLQRGLWSLWRALMQPSLLHWQQLAADSLSIAGLGLFVTLYARSAKSIMPMFVAFIIVVLLLRIPVMSWRLSLETGVGAVLGLAGALALLRAPRPLRLIVAAVAILIGFALAKLAPELSLWFKPPREVNWIPFAGRMHSLSGFAELVAGLWPFLALAALAQAGTSFRQHALWGGIPLALVAVAVELAQQGVPGHRPDITNVLLAMAGWAVPWWWRAYQPQEETADENPG
ncbi:MAG: VanZ family protein [Sulfuricella sp.]|nr:VanZ family protein [Sulfuricella sp.]